MKITRCYFKIIFFSISVVVDIAQLVINS